MPRDPHVPEAFDVYTLVVLRRPADAPEFSDEELETLQASHLAYRAELAQQGHVVANGPFLEQTDPTYRGMSIFTTDLATAARLSDDDPMVVAGRLTYDVMEWWVAVGTLDFPASDGPAGEVRSLPDD